MENIGFNPALKAAYADWMRDERGWSRQTRRLRLHTLDDACLWFRERDRFLLGAERADIVAYIGDPRNARTHDRKLADLRSFFRFLASQGLVRRDPTEGIERARERKRIPWPHAHRTDHRHSVATAPTSVGAPSSPRLADAPAHRDPL